MHLVTPSNNAALPMFLRWNPFCMKAPLVEGEDDSEANIGVIDSRQPQGGAPQPTGIPPAAASPTLTQRLSKKLSAIPAYLQTPDDPDSLRLASAEPSGSSLSGCAPPTHPTCAAQCKPYIFGFLYASGSCTLLMQLRTGAGGSSSMRDVDMSAMLLFKRRHRNVCWRQVQAARLNAPV